MEHPPKLHPWHSQWGGVSTPAPPHCGVEHSLNSDMNIHCYPSAGAPALADRTAKPPKISFRMALKRSIISVKIFRLRRLNFTLEYLFFLACGAELSYLKIFCLQHPRLDRFDLRVLHPRVPKTHSGLLPTVGWSSGEELLLPWESQWGGVLVVLLPTPPHSGVELTTIR